MTPQTEAGKRALALPENTGAVVSGSLIAAIEQEAAAAALRDAPLDVLRLARAIQDTDHAGPVYARNGHDPIPWRFLSSEEQGLRYNDARRIAAAYGEDQSNA